MNKYIRKRKKKNDPRSSQRKKKLVDVRPHKKTHDFSYFNIYHIDIKYETYINDFWFQI